MELGAGLLVIVVLGGLAGVLAWLVCYCEALTEPEPAAAVELPIWMTKGGRDAVESE